MAVVWLAVSVRRVRSGWLSSSDVTSTLVSVAAGVEIATPTCVVWSPFSWSCMVKVLLSLRVRLGAAICFASSLADLALGMDGWPFGKALCGVWAGSKVVGAAWVSVVVHEADEDMVPCVGSQDWWPASLGFSTRKPR